MRQLDYIWDFLFIHSRTHVTVNNVIELNAYAYERASRHLEWVMRFCLIISVLLQNRYDRSDDGIIYDTHAFVIRWI